ncbi:MAG: hypothetical protein RMJ67_06345 [Elusimicrobiota bacterium]|nr:hypothetical protein [Endomicrobiia bacterium]MDW8166113.1 hypothetical protein [Elusimicrobiota bacterium]
MKKYHMICKICGYEYFLDKKIEFCNKCRFSLLEIHKARWICYSIDGCKRNKLIQNRINFGIIFSDIVIDISKGIKIIFR